MDVSRHNAVSDQSVEIMKKSALEVELAVKEKEVGIRMSLESFHFQSLTFYLFVKRLYMSVYVLLRFLQE